MPRRHRYRGGHGSNFGTGFATGALTGVAVSSLLRPAPTTTIVQQPAPPPAYYSPPPDPCLSYANCRRYRNCYSCMREYEAPPQCIRRWCAVPPPPSPYAGGAMRHHQIKSLPAQRFALRSGGHGGHWGHGGYHGYGYGSGSGFGPGFATGALTGVALSSLASSQQPSTVVVQQPSGANYPYCAPCLSNNSPAACAPYCPAY